MIGDCTLFPHPVIFSIFYLILTLIGSFLFGSIPVTLVLDLVFFVAAVSFYWPFYGWNAERLCKHKIPNWMFFVFFILCSFFIQFLHTGFVQLFSADSGSFRSLTFFEQILYLFLVLIAGPLFEEVLFRGVWFPYFSEKFHHCFFAVCASSFLFAVFHSSGPQMLSAFVFGITSCGVLLLSGSLWMCIFYHILFNFIAVFVYPALVSGILQL